MSRRRAPSTGARPPCTMIDSGCSQSTTLKNFRLKLEELVSSDSKLRPFVCDGSPLEHRSGGFIVGFNPATQLQAPFWHYWCDSRGFKKDIYLQDFLHEWGRYTRTRKRIETIIQIADQKILDTNIYAYPTKRASELSKEHKTKGVLKFLLREIHPKIILAHGRRACQFFERLCGIERKGALQEATLNGRQCLFLCSRHLCLISDEQVRSIGQTFAAVLGREQ